MSYPPPGGPPEHPQPPADDPTAPVTGDRAADSGAPAANEAYDPAVGATDQPASVWDPRSDPAVPLAGLASGSGAPAGWAERDPDATQREIAVGGAAETTVAHAVSGAPDRTSEPTVAHTLGGGSDETVPHPVDDQPGGMPGAGMPPIKPFTPQPPPTAPSGRIEPAESFAPQPPSGHDAPTAPFTPSEPTTAFDQSAPAAPWEHSAPTAPFTPEGPTTPFGHSAPTAPFTPDGPTTPAGHSAPTAPFAPGAPATPSGGMPPVEGYQPPGAYGQQQGPGYADPAGFAGYGPQAAYGMPAYPAAPPPYGYVGAGRTNGLAIASLVCSLAGLFTCISAPVGIVLGHVARRQILRSGEDGAGLATAGLVVGYVVTVLGVLVLAFYLFGILLFAASQTGS
jgi:hypothetical protein